MTKSPRQNSPKTAVTFPCITALAARAHARTTKDYRKPITHSHTTRVNLAIRKLSQVEVFNHAD